MRRKLAKGEKVTLTLVALCSFLGAALKAHWILGTESLDSAIAAVNDSAARDRVGAKQPPVTKAEVISKLQERPLVMDGGAPIHQFEVIVNSGRLQSNQHLKAGVRGTDWIVELEVAGYPLMIRKTQFAP